MKTVHPPLNVEPLTAQAFAPFGEVIEVSDRAQRLRINNGFAERYHDLAKVDVGDAQDGGRALLNIFRAQPRVLPLAVSLLERHPLGSQAFMPLACRPYLVIVAPGVAAPDLTGIRCFLASGSQGVNYARGTWHHPLVALGEECDFLVVDRGGPGVNLEEQLLPVEAFWIASLGLRNPPG